MDMQQGDTAPLSHPLPPPPPPLAHLELLVIADDLAERGGNGGGREADSRVVAAPIDVPHKHVDLAVIPLGF